MSRERQTMKRILLKLSLEERTKIMFDNTDKMARNEHEIEKRMEAA